MEIFKRKIYEELLNWKKESNGKSALLIEGARRVGKSTIVEYFAKNEYKSYILVDFDKEGDSIKDLFKDGFRDLDSLFRSLSIYYGVNLYERNSLIIFDEIQKFPRIHEGMKYLVEDGRYDFIETGSLITLKLLTNDITIPSEVENIKMYPLDFEEFLWAIGDEVTPNYIKESFLKSKPLGDILHRKIINLYRIYMCVGGMPQAIEQYNLDRVNLSKVDKVKRGIINLYKDDLRKYDNKYNTFANNIFSFIPSFLSRKNKSFVFSKVKKSGRYINFINSLNAIEKSMVGNIAYNVSEPSFGLELNIINEEMKIYSLDSGLLISEILGINGTTSSNLYKSLIFDKLSLNNGMFFENSVAQALVANKHKLYYHTFKKENSDGKVNRYEIDFLINKDDNIVPIEVKSSSYKEHVSLDMFINKYKNIHIKKAYVIYSKDLKTEGKITYLPIYMTYLF